ncbi:transposase [Streptomyces sp. NPDC005752]|uniref:transposase n=1 Tax=Streptomyces sp. NPDC005752 TaxID=3157065 RepID=UPI0033E8E89C
MGSRPWIVDDELWALIEPLLPPWPERSPGPRPVPDRLCLQGILFVLYNDIAWQILPGPTSPSDSPKSPWSSPMISRCATHLTASAGGVRESPRPAPGSPRSTGWIDRDAKMASPLLRTYRNLVHPPAETRATQSADFDFGVGPSR